MHGVPPGMPSNPYNNSNDKSGYQWPKYNQPSNQDSRWKNNSDDEDESDDDDTPDPTHECAYCGTESHIESEPQKSTPHYCEDCESVTRHQKI